MPVGQKARVVTINNEETALISAADSMSTRKDICAVSNTQSLYKSYPSQTWNKYRRNQRVHWLNQ